jgi:anthranilate phosphoribosyltransferase
MHGSDGTDELTTTGSTYVSELKNGKITNFEVYPEDAGLPRTKLKNLKGGSALYNAEAIRLMLKGKPSAYRDIVIFNAAAALMIAGKAKFLKEGALIAAEAIDNGTAKSTLDKLVKITNFNTNRG